ncbi:OsmC family peroxiredoxin [Caenimonas sedimenti]|uniref:OsmC family peroxiredoxin n=1 Tax=Caenimonas sedimenti TaxID=2596921 RepID=A0A562ZXI3_9BURK|nr:OsmC family protein [Caenimonas sedimenti]TWO73091.1 OsmC family peroxiredoxin [Caenimonas sedimenti]
MSSYSSTISWDRAGADFTGRKYSRAHRWAFDGGAVVRGSSSPLSVPLPYSDAAAVDPEEALVAAVSSCHMLWFLDFAARRGLVVESYVDAAVGRMGANAAGKMAIIEVRLQPQLVFSGPRLPRAGEVEALHHQAHEHCNIANSIRAEVRVEGGWTTA